MVKDKLVICVDFDEKKTFYFFVIFIIKYHYGNKNWNLLY